MSIKLLVQHAENSTLGWGWFWERSPLVFWFSTLVFRNVPGTVPQSVPICGFKSIYFNLDRAPKIQDSVLLNYWDSFFSDLAFNFLRKLRPIFFSNSRNRCVLRLAVPRMFLCFPWHSFQLQLIFKCCHLLREKCSTVMKTEIFWNFKWLLECNEMPFFRWRNSFQSLTVNWVELMNTIHTKLMKNRTFISPIYNFSLPGHIVVYTPSQGTNTEKNLIMSTIKAKTPTLARIKQLFFHFIPNRPRLFHLSTENVRA